MQPFSEPPSYSYPYANNNNNTNNDNHNNTISNNKIDYNDPENFQWPMKVLGSAFSNLKNLHKNDPDSILNKENFQGTLFFKTNFTEYDEIDTRNFKSVLKPEILDKIRNTLNNKSKGYYLQIQSFDRSNNVTDHGRIFFKQIDSIANLNRKSSATFSGKHIVELIPFKHPFMMYVSNSIVHCKISYKQGKKDGSYLIIQSQKFYPKIIFNRNVNFFKNDNITYELCLFSVQGQNQDYLSHPKPLESWKLKDILMVYTEENRRQDEYKLQEMRDLEKKNKQYLISEIFRLKAENQKLKKLKRELNNPNKNNNNTNANMSLDYHYKNFNSIWKENNNYNTTGPTNIPNINNTNTIPFCITPSNININYTNNNHKANWHNNNNNSNSNIINMNNNNMSNSNLHLNQNDFKYNQLQHKLSNDYAHSEEDFVLPRNNYQYNYNCNTSNQMSENEQPLTDVSMQSCNNTIILDSNTDNIVIPDQMSISDSFQSNKSNSQQKINFNHVQSMRSKPSNHDSLFTYNNTVTNIPDISQTTYTYGNY